METGDALDFKYGWCLTDYKDGQFIRLKESGVVRRPDYFKDKRYASFVEEALAFYGLPMPDLETDIYRGTNHDLLFLDSHGVVVRIGKTNIRDLVNPGIIQPLHWIDNLSETLTIALYPGTALYEGIIRADNNEQIINPRFLHDAIPEFGNNNNDVNTGNSGHLTLLFKQTTYIAPILIDPDSEITPTIKTKPLLPLHEMTKADALKHCIDYVYTQTIKGHSVSNIYPVFQTLFDYHNPIRRAFSQALDKGERDPEKLKRAWKMVKNYHDTGYTIWGKQTPKGPVRCLETRHTYSPWGVEEALKNGKIDLYKIPKNKRSADVCAVAFAENPYAFTLIPDEHKTYEMCVQVLGLKVLNPINLLMHNQIPTKYMDAPLCEKLILRDPALIFFIPEEKRTDNLWSLFIENSMRFNIHEVVIRGILPQRFYTDVVKKDPEWIYALDCTLLTQEVINISARAGVNLDVLYEKMNTASKKRLRTTPKAP